jgi:asparagine synthase (glutamine-hydrolysing)
LLHGTPDELAEELRAALSRVIRRGIEGLNRVAVQVSGGLDSSTVLAHALLTARTTGRPTIDAITLSFAGQGDDRSFATELCDELGIHAVRVVPSDGSKHVLRALTADAAPLIWPTAAWEFSFRDRMKELGSDVVLTGQGGDDVFSGDPRVFARPLLTGQWWKAIAGTARFHRRSRMSLLQTARLLLGLPVYSVTPRILKMKRYRAACRKWTWAGPRLREIMREVLATRPPNADWKSAGRAPTFERLINTNFMRIVETRGQLEAATGVKRVDPLMDDEIVSLVARMPQEVLLLGDRQRGLLRHTLSQMVPERVRNRSTKGHFETAIFEMVRASDLRQLRSLSGVQMLADLGLVEPAPYRRHFEAVLSAGETCVDWLTFWPALGVEGFTRLLWGRPIDEAA